MTTPRVFAHRYSDGTRPADRFMGAIDRTDLSTVRVLYRILRRNGLPASTARMLVHGVFHAGVSVGIQTAHDSITSRLTVVAS